MYPEGAAELEAELEGYLALPSMHVAYSYLLGKVYPAPVEASADRLATYRKLLKSCLFRLWNENK